MVDTINPQTGQSDNFEQKPQQPQPIGQPNPGNFYAGFGKPEDVHVNLVDEPQVRLVPAPSEAPKNTVPDTVGPVAPPVNKPESQAYSNHRSPLNFRLILFTAVIGLVCISLAGGITYFVAGSSNQRKIESAQGELTDLEGQLRSLKVTPDRLELPQVEPAPVTNTETPAAPPIEEKPIETPTPAPATTTEPVGMG